MTRLSQAARTAIAFAAFFVVMGAIFAWQTGRTDENDARLARYAAQRGAKFERGGSDAATWTIRHDHEAWKIEFEASPRSPGQHSAGNLDATRIVRSSRCRSAFSAIPELPGAVLHELAVSVATRVLGRSPSAPAATTRLLGGRSYAGDPEWLAGTVLTEIEHILDAGVQTDSPLVAALENGELRVGVGEKITTEAQLDALVHIAARIAEVVETQCRR